MGFRRGRPARPGRGPPWRVYQIERRLTGRADHVPSSRRIFHKLLLDFTWWVNRKDRDGRNVFQGGFLGLDNIGLFDRDAGVPDRQLAWPRSSGTAWMAACSA